MDAWRLGVFYDSMPLFVCAVMLVNGRDQMVRRALRSFREQTYRHKRLFIFDSGKEPVMPETYDLDGDGSYRIRVLHADEAQRGLPIGALRNVCNAIIEPDIVCHWDSDDWSDPCRIEEQVELLTGSLGVDIVGYNRLLFWQSGPERAWIYQNVNSRYAVGASLCYWHRVWCARRFRDDMPARPGATGEDTEFLRERTVLGVDAIQDRPQMIAAIHGANSMPYDNLERSPSWQRATEWDNACRAIMQL